MEGSPCRKSSISWKGGRSLGPIPGFLSSGDLERSFIGDPGPGSCLKAGVNDTGVFSPTVCSLFLDFFLEVGE